MRVVINFSSLRKKRKKKKSTSNKSFPRKMAKHIPWMQQQRYTASAAAAPALHSSNGAACSACWGRRLFPKFWGALCMQSTLAGALLLANSLQLVVKALPRGTKTEHACTSMHQRAPACTSVHHKAAQPSVLRSSSPHLPGQVRILPQPRAMQGFSDMLEPIIFKEFVQLLELLPQMQRKGVKPHLLRARQQSSIRCAS